MVIANNTHMEITRPFRFSTTFVLYKLHSDVHGTPFIRASHRLFIVRLMTAYKFARRTAQEMRANTLFAAKLSQGVMSSSGSGTNCAWSTVVSVDSGKTMISASCLDAACMKATYWSIRSESWSSQVSPLNVGWNSTTAATYVVLLFAEAWIGTLNKNRINTMNGM